MSINPYADTAQAYLAAGWAGVIPVPYAKKSPVPTGYTGEGGAYPTPAEVAAWSAQRANIALRYPPNVVALDVDGGAAEFLALTKTLGPLPQTWRNVGNPERWGHFLFRLPDGVDYRDLKAPCAGVDLLRHSHRYSVVAPSAHPDGHTYGWVRPAGCAGDVPRVADLPVLPDTWVKRLQGPGAPTSATASTGGASATWDMFKGPASAQLGEPIHSNHDDALSAYTASLCARGYGREEAMVLALARAEDVVGGDPGRPFGERDFGRWWRGAEAKFTPVEPLPELVPVRIDPVTAQPLEATPYDREVAKEAMRLKVAGEARRIVARGEVPELPDTLPSLRLELLLPPEPVRWAIDGLLPAGGNAVLTAGFKAGKTTTMLNLIKALVDGEPFLGRFEARRAKVGLFNYEVSTRQMREWARDAQIDNPDDVAAMHLRGHRLPLTDPDVQDRVVAWLLGHQIDFWIVDPLGPALAGTDENSNTDVRQVLMALDGIKERAGVTDLVVTHHTGRGAEAQNRARGATVVDDWPDARWILTREEELDSARFFRADGRDVSVDEEQLQFDNTTRALTLGGWDKGTLMGRKRADKGAGEVMAAVLEVPGINTTDLAAAISGSAATVYKTIAAAVGAGLIREVQVGKRMKLYYPIERAA